MLVVIAALGAVATTRTPSTATTTTKKSASVTNLADNPELPQLYSEAKAKGTQDKTTWGNCDPTTGRIKIPTVYAPPCVPAFAGDNGGATSQGVTATTIKIVWFLAPKNDITASIAGQLDTPADTIESARAYAKMFEATFETYGRKVEIVPYTGTGIGTDETAARADAVKVATQIKAFASIGGPSQTPVYADELAARHVLCIGCGISVPNSAFEKNAPYMWGTLSTPEQYLENIGILLTKELNNKPAIWAGDPKFRKEKRVFGTVHYEQDPPVFSGTSEVVTKLGKQNGWEAKVNLTYLLDLTKLPEIAAGLIAKLKNAGVTTVTFLGDPIMPIYLTKAATAQHYYPEWIVTGTVLTDTTALARNYDPTQWAHAFGLSTLPARVPQKDADAYRVYTLVLRRDAEGVEDLGRLLPQPAAALPGHPPRRRRPHARDLRRRAVPVSAHGWAACRAARQLRPERPVPLHQGRRLRLGRRLDLDLVGPEHHGGRRAGQGRQGHVPLRRHGQALPARAAAVDAPAVLPAQELLHRVHRPSHQSCRHRTIPPPKGSPAAAKSGN